MTLTIKTETEFARIDCGNCGGSYAILEKYREQKEQEGGSWTCPYCRCWWGYATGENERLREAARKAEASRDAWHRRADSEYRSKVAYKGQITKIKKRVAGGACPCCNRTFADLAAHMKTKHPDYLEERS